MTKSTIEEQVTVIGTSVAKSITKSIYETGHSQYEKVLVILEFCFHKYLIRAYKKYSKIKTLLYRDSPVDLEKHYIPADFELDGREENITECELQTDKNQFSRIVISGTAGSGKSLFLKSLLLRLLKQDYAEIPVFVELRYLNQHETNFSIWDYIFKLLNDINGDFTKKQLEYSLKSGKLILLLDGFDEIDHSRRITYEKEILELSYKYSDTQIIISSRPDDIFSAWDEFHVLEIRPFTQDKAIQLIEKIEYEHIVKKNFLNKLRENHFFKKHRSFLSNPLLITMMLLTYEQLAEIPGKLHIFYEKAFDTLFHRHDALKAVYKRKSFSNLPIDNFKNLFSTFCVLSYSDNIYSFSKDSLNDYLKKS